MASENARWPRAGTSAFLLTLFFYSALFLFTFHEADEDVWGRMAVGRLVLTSSQVPREDVFSYVPTKSPWVDHEWLSGVIFYEVHRRFSGAGLVWLRAALGLGAVALVFTVSRMGGAAPPAVAAMSLSTSVLVLQGFNGVIRAQAFSFLLFSFFWFALERGGRRIWLLVPASALWANLHGGVVTGLLLIGVYAVVSPGRRRRLSAAFALSVAATLVTPYGVHYWEYLAGALSMPRPEIVEWRSVTWTPFLDDPHLKLSGLLVVGVVVLSRARGATKLPALVMVVGTLAASWLHVRFAPFLALAMVVVLPGPLQALFEKGQSSFPRRWAPSLSPLTVTILMLALLFTSMAVAWRERDFVPRMTVPEDRYPVAAVDVLESSTSSGRLAVYFNWGEYALYHLYPRFRVSFDGRYETVYADDVVQANWDFTHGAARGERLLEQYPADFALYPRDSGAARWLAASPQWEKAHSDGLSVLYRNKNTDDGKRLKTAPLPIEEESRGGGA